MTQLYSPNIFNVFLEDRTVEKESAQLGSLPSIDYVSADHAADLCFAEELYRAGGNMIE